MLVVAVTAFLLFDSSFIPIVLIGFSAYSDNLAFLETNPFNK